MIMVCWSMMLVWASLRSGGMMVLYGLFLVLGLGILV